jgi:hypothetical protein
MKRYKSIQLTFKIDEASNAMPPLCEAQQGLQKFIMMITRAWPARLICLPSSKICARNRDLLQRQSIQHADHESAHCTYLPARSIVLDPGSREFCQGTRTERFVNRWIASNTIPIKNRIQEIWTATAATPAIFRAPAMTPTTKNISA